VFVEAKKASLLSYVKQHIVHTPMASSTGQQVVTEILLKS